MTTSYEREAPDAPTTPDDGSPPRRPSLLQRFIDHVSTPSSEPTWLFRIMVPLALAWLAVVIVLAVLGVPVYGGAAGSN